MGSFQPLARDHVEAAAAAAVLTGRVASFSAVLRLTPRGVAGGGMTVSSRVVLLPSIPEAPRMLGSSTMVWSAYGNERTQVC